MNLRQINSLLPLAVLLTFGLANAAGQTPDSSGNALLKGSFRFRHVAVLYVDSNYNPTEIAATYGTIVFDGAGNYTVTATTVDNIATSGVSQPLSVTGTYAIGSSGAGYLTNPLNESDPSTNIYGAVSQGVFAGSSVQSQSDATALNDIFVAIPAGAPPSNASFTSSYQTGLLDFPGADSVSIKNALFDLIPDGKGGLGTISLNGHEANQGDGNVTQSVSGATYSFNSRRKCDPDNSSANWLDQRPLHRNQNDFPINRWQLHSWLDAWRLRHCFWRESTGCYGNEQPEQWAVFYGRARRLADGIGNRLLLWRNE